MTDTSAVCRFFNQLSRKNKLLLKKLRNLRKLVKNYREIFICYDDVFVSFSSQLSASLKEHINEENLLKVRGVIMDKVYFSVLPFHIWYHLFCVKGLNISMICVNTVQSCIFNIQISDHVNEKLFASIYQLPVQLRKGMVITEKVYLFAHTNVFIKNHLFRSNFGSLYYESISSPFLLWKSYLDILCRAIFNVSYKFVLPILVSGVDLNCRKFTAYTSRNCSGLKVKKVRAIFFKKQVEFCNKLSRTSCLNVDPYFF